MDGEDRPPDQQATPPGAGLDPAAGPVEEPTPPAETGAQPDGAPPPSPPPVYWAAPAGAPPTGTPPTGVPPPGWVMPPDAGHRLDVGGVIGRTFDTYGREWSLFLALALPVGLLYAVQAFLPQDRAAADDVGTLALLIVATIGLSLLALLSTVATMVATDRLWRGERPGLLDTYSAAGRPALRLVGLALLAVLVFVLGGVVVAVPFLVLAQLGILGALLMVVALIALVVALIVVGIRLYLVFPVIVLEGLGPVAAVGRAWALSRGQAILLFVLAFVLGIVAALPVYGAALFGFAADPRVLAIAFGIAGLVVTPLAGIAYTLAWNDLAGPRYTDSEGMARGRGRRTGAVLVFGVGLVLGVAGIGVAASRLGDLDGLAADRPNAGQIVFGRAEGSDPCVPGEQAFTFTSADEIYVGGYFAKAVPRGASARVVIRSGGVELGSEALRTDGLLPVQCYYELEPISGAAPGLYEFVVELEGESIARGLLVVTAP